MSNAFSGVGTKLYRSTDNAVFTALSEINSINGPGMSRDTIDTTSLDSVGGFREFIAGFRDGGEMSFEMNMSHVDYELLLGDFNVDTMRYWKLVLPDSLQTIFSFTGLVTQLPLSVPMDDKVTVNVTIKISGSVTYYEGSSTTTA